jgi:hypothetical protein
MVIFSLRCKELANDLILPQYQAMHELESVLMLIFVSSMFRNLNYIIFPFFCVDLDTGPLIWANRIN